jgi:hypothetical protein
LLGGTACRRIAPIDMLGFVEVGAVVAALAGGSVGEVMPAEAPTCRIDGPSRVRGEVGVRGRVWVRPLLVRCAMRGRVRVSVRSADRRLGRLRGVRFSIPARQSSRIRLGGRAFVARSARRGVLGRSAVLRVSARPSGSRATRRRLEMTLRRPSRRSPRTPLLGVGDQAASMFTDPLFAPLQVRIARLVVPWDAMRSRAVSVWLTAARRAGMEPLVAFGHARGDRCPGSPCRLPGVRAYRARFRAFHRRFPWVRTITPWNEPNHASQPTVSVPGRAARYYNAVRAACSRCTVVAGDLLDAPNMGRYLARYRRALAGVPAVWGLHNYFDTTYGGTAGLKTMARAVEGRIWLTETGGIVTSRRSNGRVGLRYDEDRAARGVRRAIAMADARPRRVPRVYLYQWRAGHDFFDAGLLGRDGTPRPGYRVLRSAMRRHVAPLLNGRP